MFMNRALSLACDPPSQRPASVRDCRFCHMRANS